MSRDDLVRTNADIVKQVSQEIKRHCPNAIVVVVSNPLDVMCWVTKQVTGFSRERVFGMAGGRGTAPHPAFLAAALDPAAESRPAVVPGGARAALGPPTPFPTAPGDAPPPPLPPPPP